MFISKLIQKRKKQDLDRWKKNNTPEKVKVGGGRRDYN